MSKHIDADAYSVYDYRTGERLEGSPTEELVRESLSSDQGAAKASYDRDDALWSLDTESDRVVYVMED